MGLIVHHRLPMEYVLREPSSVCTHTSLALEQHRDLAQSLRELGHGVRILQSIGADLSACCVSDRLLVAPNLCVPATPGLDSDDWLSSLPVQALAWPSGALFDASDAIADTGLIYVGHAPGAPSPGTNHAGLRALAHGVLRLGYGVKAVDVRGAPRLRSILCHLGGNLFLGDRARLGTDRMRGVEWLDLPPEEPWAAGLLRIGQTVILAASAPRTAELLAQRGLNVISVELSAFDARGIGPDRLVCNVDSEPSP